MEREQKTEISKKEELQSVDWNVNVLLSTDEIEWRENERIRVSKIVSKIESYQQASLVFSILPIILWLVPSAETK